MRVCYAAAAPSMSPSSLETALANPTTRQSLQEILERLSSSALQAGVGRTSARTGTKSTAARVKARRVSSDNTWNRKSPIAFSSLQSDPGLLAQTVEQNRPAQLRSLSTSDVASCEAGPGETPDLLADSAIKSPPKLETQSSGSSLLLAQAVDDLNVAANDSLEEARDYEGDQVMSGTGSMEEAKEEAIQPRLEFYIPQSTLQGALEAAKKGLPRYWSFTMYRGPENKEVAYHYCRDKEQSEQIAKLFVGEQLLGMDLEWKPFIRKDADAPLKDRVSLIQLASQDRIGLFHIARFQGSTTEDLLAPTLKQIIEDENVRKIGVNIANDGGRLREYLGVDSKGLFELSHLHRLVKYARSNPSWVNKRLVSLSAQVEEHLLLPLKKDDVRTSDWTLPLRHSQIVYAASDVYASVHLYDVLDMKRRAMSPAPPMPENWDKKKPIRLSDTETFAKDDDAEDAEDDPNIAPVAEDGDILEEGQSAATATPAKPRKPRTTTPKEKKMKESPVKADQGPEWVQSHAWAIEYRASDAYKNKSLKMRPTQAALRAYALWQHHNLDVPRLAMLLGVKEVTVACYVAGTLQLEDLTFDRQRMVSVLDYIPQLQLFRYWKIRRACLG